MVLGTSNGTESGLELLAHDISGARRWGETVGRDRADWLRPKCEKIFAYRS
jgi:hypothetical protein